MKLIISFLLLSLVILTGCRSESRNGRSPAEAQNSGSVVDEKAMSEEGNGTRDTSESAESMINGYPVDFFALTLSSSQDPVLDDSLVPGIDAEGEIFLLDNVGRSWQFDLDQKEIALGNYAGEEEGDSLYAFSGTLRWMISALGISRFVSAEDEEELTVVRLSFDGDNAELLGGPEMIDVGVTENEVIRSSFTGIHIYSYAELSMGVQIFKLPETFSGENLRPLKGGPLVDQKGYWFWSPGGFVILSLENEEPIWFLNEGLMPSGNMGSKFIFGNIRLGQDQRLSFADPVIISGDSQIESSVEFKSIFDEESAAEVQN